MVLKKSGGLGGGRSPTTGSEGVHMGFAFAARMIAAAILHSLKITWGVGGNATPHLQTDSLYDDLKNAITTTCLTQFLLMVRFSSKTACMAQKKRLGGPPICKHLYDGFWVFENQPAWRKKSGGFGGGAAPPPPQLQTPLSRVLTGSIWVLAFAVS